MYKLEEVWGDNYYGIKSLPQKVPKKDKGVYMTFPSKPAPKRLHYKLDDLVEALVASTIRINYIPRPKLKGKCPRKYGH